MHRPEAAVRPRLRRVLAATFVLVAPAPAGADEMPTFVVEMNDGVLAPARIEIPANTAVKIIVRNTGTTPAEFESLPLKREKVLAPGAESFIVIRRVSPGEYPFFDEFHMDVGQGVIVAR